MATHSSILAWRIPWTEEPGGLQSIGSQGVEHETERLTLSLSVLLADSLSGFDGARHHAGDTRLHANQSLVGVVLGG